MDQEEEAWPDLSIVYTQLNRKELGFRPKKLTISKDIQSKPCEICSIGFDRKQQIEERGMGIISCFGCGLSCHLYCYGIRTQIEINDHPNNQGYFVCDRCKVNQKSDQICVICQQKGGLKKKLLDCNEFVHPQCALGDSTVELVSFLDLSFRKRKQTIEAICDLCGNNNANNKCHDCDKNCHLGCVISEINQIGGQMMGYCENEDKSKMWSLKFKYKQLFQLGTVNGQFQTQQVKAQARSIMKQFFTIQQDVVDINIDQLFEQFISTNRIEEEKDQLINMRCPEHTLDEIYCVCQMKQDDIEMIQCDSCSEWYHQSCVMTPQQFAELSQQDYYCCYCQQWTTNKMNHILKFSPAIKIEQILPKYQIVTIPLLLCLGIYCERSLFKLQENYQEQEFQLTESLLSNIPFPNALNEKISILKEKAHIAEFMNYLLKSQTYRSTIWTVKSQMNEDCTPIQENIIQNNKLKNKLKKVLILFKDYEDIQFFNNLEIQLNKLQSAYDIIQNKTKITKQDLNFYANQETTEFNWFHDQKIQYSQWKIKIVSKFKNTKNQLDEFIQELDIEDELEQKEYILQLLNKDSEIENEEEFQLLITELKQWINSKKIPKETLRNLLDEAHQFIFHINWVEEILKEIQNGDELSAELKTLPLVYNNQESIYQNLRSIENSVIFFEPHTQYYQFESKLELYTQQMELLTLFQSDDESECELQTAPKEINQRISRIQLNNLLELHKQIQGPESNLELIQEIIQKLDECSDKFNIMIQTKNLNEQLRKKFASEINMNKQFDIPEVKQLQERLDVFTEVEKVKTSKVQTQKQLIDSLEKAQLHNLDEKIINYFEQELKKCKSLLSRITALLSLTQFNSEQLEQVKELLSELQSGKIQFEEKAQLQSIQKAIIFVDQLYDFYQKYKSPDQEMEIEFDKNPDLEFKLNQINNPKTILFQKSDILLGDLEQIMSKPITILDERILHAQSQYSEFLLEKQWELLQIKWENNQEISLALIEQVLKKEDPLTQQFREAYQNDYERMNYLNNSINNILYNPCLNQIMDWQTKFNEITIKIKGGLWDQLKIHNLWVSVTLKFLEIQNENTCTYESLKLLQEIIQLSHIPKNGTVNKICQQKIQYFNSLVDKLKDYNNRKAQYSMKSLSKNKSHYALKDARNLDCALQSCKINHEGVSKEFYADFQTFLQISQEESNLTSMYQKMQQCFIYDEESCEILRIQIYSQKLQEIISGTKMVDLTKAKKQFNTYMQLLKKHPKDDTSLEDQFQLILNKAESINLLIQKMKSNTPYTFSELSETQTLLEQTNQIQIDNSQQIEITYLECVQCQKEVEEIRNSTLKVKESTMLALQEKLSRLPLQEEQEFITNSIENYRNLQNQYKQLRNTITKQKVNPNGQQLTDLMNQFKQAFEKVIIFYQDADHMLNQYEEFQKKLDEIEQNIQNEDAFNQFHDLLQIFRWGQQYERVKMHLWIKQVNHFRENQSIRWGLTQLRNFLTQGYDIIDYLLQHGPKTQLDKIKGPLTYLEGLMQKIIDAFMVTTVDQSGYVDGKIDYYELGAEVQHISPQDKLARMNELKPKKPFDDLKQYQEKKNRIQKLKQDPEEPKKVKKVSKEEQIYMNTKTHAVTQQVRDQQKQIIIHQLQQNPVFRQKESQYLEKRCQEIENQEFGEHHRNRKLYLEKMEKINQAFKELIQCPNFSRKVLRKNFNSEVISFLIKKLNTDSVTQFEEQINNKKQKDNYDPLAVKSLKPTSIVNKTKLQSKPKVNNKNDDFLQQILDDVVPQQRPTPVQYLPQINKRKSPSPPPSMSQRKESTSQSELPELRIETNDNPILYNPDAPEEPITKPAVTQQKLNPIVFGDKIFKLGRKYKLGLLDKQMQLELYTQCEENKLKYTPKLSSEMKGIKQYPFQLQINNCERQSQKNDFSAICGWCLPEKYSEIGEMNKIADKLRNEQMCYQQNIADNAIFIIAHQEQLIGSTLFVNIQVPELVTEQQMQRKESGIWRYWGNAQSKLCFIIYVKNIRMSSLSSFQPIQFDLIKNIIKVYNNNYYHQNKEVLKWVESKINEYKKNKQQNIQNKPELEPVTDEEDENNHQQFQIPQLSQQLPQQNQQTDYDQDIKSLFQTDPSLMQQLYSGTMQ